MIYIHYYIITKNQYEIRINKSGNKSKKRKERNMVIWTKKKWSKNALKEKI